MIQEITAQTQETQFKNFWCHMCKMEIIQRGDIRGRNEEYYCLMCESPLEIIQSSSELSEVKQFEIYISPDSQISESFTRSLSVLLNIEEIFSMMRILNLIERVFPNEDESLGATEQQIESLPQHTFTEDDTHSTCNICFDDFKQGDVQNHMSCDHHFHKDCLTTWLKINNSCPTCRTKIL